MFEFGEHLLDRIEVWTIGRQEDEMRAFGADGIASCFAFVTAEIVEDDDVTLGQRRGEDLGGIDREELTVDGTVDDLRRADPIETQRGNKGHGLPMAVRHHCMEALVSRSPATQWRHVGFDPGLVDEHQPRGVNLVLVCLPALPLTGDVRSILLGGSACFF